MGRFHNYKLPLDFIQKSKNAEYFPVMAKAVEANIELPVNKPACLVFKEGFCREIFIAHILLIFWI